jgi:hypothetical protein
MFHLGKRSVGGAVIVDNDVLDLVGLHVKMATSTTHTHLSRQPVAGAIPIACAIFKSFLLVLLLLYLV